jgi:hypothetical protein
VKGKTVTAPAIKATENRTPSHTGAMLSKHAKAAAREAQICQEANGS